MNTDDISMTARPRGTPTEATKTSKVQTKVRSAHNYASSAALPRVSVTAALSLSEQRVLAMRSTSRPPPSEARSKCWCPANSASSEGLWPAWLRSG